MREPEVTIVAVPSRGLVRLRLTTDAGHRADGLALLADLLPSLYALDTQIRQARAAKAANVEDRRG
jgi:hypothetical protein